MKELLNDPRIVTTVKLMVSIGLLAGLITYVDFASVAASFRTAHLLYLAAGIALAVLQVLIHLYRWRYLLRLVTPDATDREVVTSFFVGFMAGFFTPAQLGEFAGRIASHPNVPRLRIVGITIVDKVYWTVLTFVIGGSGLLVFLSGRYPDAWTSLYRYAATFLFGVIITIVLYPDRLKDVLAQLPERIRRHRFYVLIDTIEQVFHNRNAWMTFFLTSALYGVILLEFYLLLNAFGDVTLDDAMMCGACIFFVKAVIIPISFGDLGVRESAAVFFLGTVGTPAAVAFNASIVMSLANVIIPTAIGAVLVNTLQRK